MRKELVSGIIAAGLAVAAVGGAACQRPPERPDIEATVQARVQATLTAGQSGVVEPAGTPSPFPPPLRAEAQKPAGEEITIRLKPEELLWTLRTTLFSQNTQLPTGFTSKEHLVLVPTQKEQQLKALGKINVGIDTHQDTIAAGIYYTVFPDNRGAKSLYTTLVSLSDNPVDLEKELSYPASLSRYPTGLGIFAAVDNTLVHAIIFTVASSTKSQVNIKEGEIIALAKAAVKHLQKVGR